MHIIRLPGKPAARYPFLGLKWFVGDSNTGIAWGVLTTLSIKHLLYLVRGQDMEEEIQFPCYQIGATGEGYARLGQNMEDPFPLWELIFLN